MALTSTEITRLLQPMKDFAPAILRCAEIVAAAEEAERTIRGQAPMLQAIQAEIDAILKQKREAEAEMAGLQGLLEEARMDTAREKHAVTESLNELRAACRLAQDTLQATKEEHANLLARHRQEADEVLHVLEAQRKALDEFRRAIPSV